MKPEKWDGSKISISYTNYVNLLKDSVTCVHTYFSNVTSPVQIILLKLTSEKTPPSLKVDQSPVQVMETGHYRFGDAIKSTLPIDEWLARENLQRINPGPDGPESMRYARCNLRIAESNKNSR